MVESARAIAQQEVISEALWRLLSRGGLQKLTLRAVAAEAGCTTGLVMSRFPTKRALLLHARQMLHERTAARMTATASTVSDPAEALLAVLVDSTLRPEFDASIWVGFIAASISDEELRAFHVAANRHYLQTVNDIVARLRPDWSEETARQRATELVALATGFAVLAGVDGTTYSEQAQRTAYERAVTAIAESDVAKDDGHRRSWAVVADDGS